MKKNPRTRIIVMNLARTAAISIIGVLLVFQVYTFVNQKEGSSPLPPLFGNFPNNRQYLETQQPKEEFAFAVIGDTKSHGMFERIAEELKTLPLDFAVLLGDCTYGGTEGDHRYFRAELVEEYAQPFPVFYVVGNHDVSPQSYPITRFEKEYGPSIFSFEYQRCLFIVLRILDAPWTNEESISFLNNFRTAPSQKYRHIFVFMHIPPPVSSVFTARNYEEHEELVRLFDEIGVDYVFAGDFHGYARVNRRDTAYVITGGGGSHLNHGKGRQFHHAFVMRVHRDGISETIIPYSWEWDIEDSLEAFAISGAWPWMTRNIPLVAALNIVLLALLVILSWPIRVSALRTRRNRDSL